MRYLLTTLLFSALLSAKMLDRIAIVVDHRIITETQLQEELQVTAFLNRQPINTDVGARRAAADRLVEQELVRREMRLSQYPLPSDDDVNELFEAQRQQSGSEALLEKELGRYGIDSGILRRHLRFQLMMLRFIDFRFRPDVQITDTDINHYYERQVQTWKQSHTGPPPGIEESRASIEKALSDQRVDYALSSWLEETRKQVDIVYLDKELE
jgi:hypothetical protein